MINILLTNTDWHCVKQLVDVLAPFKEATLLASRNGESLMVTNIIPLFQFCTETLEESLKSFRASDDIYIGIEAGLEKLNHYYDKISPMIGVSLFLDPTKKKSYLQDALGWKTGWVNSVIDNFEASFDFYKSKLCVIPTAIEDLSNELDTDESLFLKYKKRKRNPEAGIINHGSEYTRYLNSPLANEDTHILVFWKANSEDYPILSAMAKDYLTVQASSVSAERAFSSGTDLVTPDRCSLSGKTIEMTQFLKYHL